MLEHRWKTPHTVTEANEVVWGSPQPKNAMSSWWWRLHPGGVDPSKVQIESLKRSLQLMKSYWLSIPHHFTLQFGRFAPHLSPRGMVVECWERYTGETWGVNTTILAERVFLFSSCSSSSSSCLSCCCSTGDGGGGAGGSGGSGGDVVKQFAESSGVPVGKVVNFLTNSHFKKNQTKRHQPKKRPFLPIPPFCATAIYISHHHHCGWDWIIVTSTLQKSLNFSETPTHAMLRNVGVAVLSHAPAGFGGRCVKSKSMEG